MIKKIWVPAVILPVIICAFIFLMIVGIGESLLFTSIEISGEAAVALGVSLLTIIAGVSWFVARRVDE
ncbi:hypothetical protein [Sphaerobacter thermophilus]|uniref:Uncharacterized protein n=1 Tax=Sphaerobacter thermophilus (strain ATCC 49802 / DSM 20745 / KCCM 41009 / NCIMB 13125 / S 6022) TaxID=479434 RepID=D1C9N5_SPHTD|nr:hypothetical protein [Sphaerobacter thermophilus]ACZ40528.1 hypothetical protein Sthe_3128 [Sphaerobacter thermophilus DSM 20745]PZN60331.1 MAG: hypothetical protein DIU58_16180 [Sphaerobacter thermophilus]